MTLDRKIKKWVTNNKEVRYDLIRKVEKEIDTKIEYADPTDYANENFFEELEEKIEEAINDYQIGDEIVMNHLASEPYSFTKEGSTGTVKAIKDGGIINVYFDHMTGNVNTSTKKQHEVEGLRAYKAQYADKLIKYSGNYQKFAQELIENCIEKTKKGNIGNLDESYTTILKALSNQKVALLVDSSQLKEIKLEALRFKELDTGKPTKYLRASATTYLDWSSMATQTITINKITHGGTSQQLHLIEGAQFLGSATQSQVEKTKAEAEKELIKEAKKIGANYLLITNKEHSIPMKNMMLETIEAIPYGVIGEKELETILEIDNLDKNIENLITNLPVLSEKLGQSYEGMAKFNPQRYLELFENSGEERQKDMIKSVMQYIQKDTLNKNIKEKFLTDEYKPIVKEVVSNAFRDDVLEEENA